MKTILTWQPIKSVQPTVTVLDPAPGESVVVIVTDRVPQLTHTIRGPQQSAAAAVLAELVIGGMANEPAE